MKWDNGRKYAYSDYLKWKEAGYMGMELIDGIPYQYGVSAFEQEPVQVTPDTQARICVNLCARISQCLEATPYQARLSQPVRLGDDILTPDIAVAKVTDNIPILIVETAASEKYERLRQCQNAGADYWILYPNTRQISAHTSDDVRIYEVGDSIPIARIGYIANIKEIWE